MSEHHEGRTVEERPADVYRRFEASASGLAPEVLHQRRPELRWRHVVVRFVALAGWRLPF